MTNHNSIAKRFMVVLLVAALAAPNLAIARYNPRPGWNLFSVEQEVQIGQQEAAKVDKQMPLLNDPEINRYIQRLGARLAAKAPGAKYPYTFKVVNQKEINAFALPGGPTYINLGTIQAADNESELAGVMAHEISHVVMRHSTNQATKQMAAQIPLAVLGGKLGGGMAGQLSQLGISFVAGSVFLKYSRDAEKQADLVGAGILNDAGFNPQGMVSFFRKLGEESGRRGGGSDFFQSHPNPGNRAQYVQAEVNTLPRRALAQDSAEFRAIKRRVAGMRGLSAQEIQQRQQGGNGSGNTTTRRTSSVRPSSNFKRLEHSEFSVGYPENWNVFGDANSTVTIAPQDGIAQDAIAYGAIISGFEPERSGNRNPSLDDATQQLLRSLRQSNPDLRQVGNGENFRLNGMPAKSVILVGPSPIGREQDRPERERDWLVTVMRNDGSMVYFVFISPEADFNEMQPAFEKMLRSLRLK